MKIDSDRMKKGLQVAVAHFWGSRTRQATAQKKRGSADQGARAAVTGGAQMDGFVGLIAQIIQDAGIPEATVHRNKHLELPGYFRATKRWDLVVVADGALLAVIEAKSQVGPSFGNNFNNRTEEAIGSAVDLWTAYREGAFPLSPRTWLGYLFLLEDCERSRAPVSVDEPHFQVFSEFRDASYKRRYELLCRKLVRERHYEAAAFLTSSAAEGKEGEFDEPAADLTFAAFAASLAGSMSAFAAAKNARENG
ncbi:MAG: PaeR7I family type II restriction endonuclease [Planctomycetota bacterium]